MLYEQFLKWIQLGFASNGLHNYTFFTPVKWNQGCFDAAYYCAVGEVHHVYFFQCTLSVTHEYKSQWTANFLQHLFPLSNGMATRGMGSASTALKVHFYVFTTKEKEKVFHHGAGESIGMVQNFDSSFTVDRLKIVYLPYTPLMYNWINIPVLCHQPTNLIFSYDIPTKQTCLFVCVCVSHHIQYRYHIK